MLTQKRKTTFVRALLISASLIVIVAGLKFAADVLTPIILALFLAIICLPILRWLQHKRVPNWLALIIMMLGLIICLALVALFVYISLNGLTDKLPAYQVRLLALVAQTEPLFQSLGINTKQLFSVESLNAGGLFSTLTGFLRATVGSLTNLFLVILGAAFAMLEAQSLSVKMQQAGSRAETLLGIGRRFSTAAQQFIYLKAANNLIVAVGATLFLFFYGIDFALLWGFLIFLLSYIPNIGIVIACVPPVLLALLQHGIWGAVLVVGVLVVINFIGDNIITPRLMGPGLDLSLSVIFFTFVFWAWLFGASGALLSVLLTALVKFVLESFDETRWFATLMGQAPKRAPEQTRGVSEPPAKPPAPTDETLP